MERRLDRKFTLNRDDMRRALWAYLKSNDIPVPIDHDEMQIVYASELGELSKVEITWTENDTIENRN